MELDWTLARLAEGAREVLQADAAVVYLLDEAGSCLRTAAVCGLAEEWEPHKAINVERSFLNKEALAGRPAIVADALADQQAGELPQGCCSGLCVPLAHEGGPLGALHVYTQLPRQFGQVDVGLLMPLADLATAAIAAAREVSALKALEDSKAHFIRCITHELRSPVSAVQSLVRTVNQGYAGPLTDRQAEVFERISHRLDFLEILINDLLNLAEGDLPEWTDQERYVNLHSTLQQVVHMLQPCAEERGLIFSYSPCPEELLVWAGEEGLHRIFLNLVDNALKYTLAGGNVILSVSRADDMVQVHVADSGIGIPPESLPHLFDEFYRAPNARSVDAAGTGLGLTIVKKLVERYNGKIDVKSALGAGTTFTVTLPLAQPGGQGK
jgi:two-component system phosphate regulon sensor histidine kinase PhoR